MANNKVSKRSRNRRANRQSSMVDTLFNALIRTTAHPIALILFIFTVVFVASELIETKGPLEYLDEYLQAEIKLETNKIAKFLLSIFDKVIKFLIQYKNIVGAIAAYLIPVITRPNKTNLIIVSALIVVSITFASIQTIYHFCFALVFWSYLQVNLLYHRFIVVVFAVVIFIISVVNSNKNDSPNAPSGPPATSGRGNPLPGFT